MAHLGLFQSLQRAHATRVWPTMSQLLEKLRFGLILFSVIANALSAGAIFTFPVMAAALSKNLKLTQPQLTTIALGGMVGQYPAAAGVGYLIDTYGPWLCSLLAAILFSVGFGLFSLECAKTPGVDDLLVHSPQTSFYILTFLFLLCGLGTVNSYFSSLFAATRTFPRHPGIASGVSMGLFGLSPLLFTLIAGNRFNTGNEELDVIGYTRFLSILTLVVHLIGALTLNVKHSKRRAEHSDDSEDDEETPLIRSTISLSDPLTPLTGVLRDATFWLLAFIVAMTLGSSEMVISNAGSIVLSLPSSLTAFDSPTAITAQQVRLLSFSNTVSRLLVGSIADWMSPIGHQSRDDIEEPNVRRRKFTSRVVVLAIFCLTLSVAFAYGAGGMKSRSQMWLLSVGVGVSYGAVFTLVPSLVSVFWGSTNVARNFGLITYAPFLFTPAFSYLYAFLSASQADGPICYGRECTQTTFIVASGATATAMLASCLLWRWWGAKV